MLRLLDARAGSYAEVKPARPGLLRVCAQLPGPDEPAGITGLRVLLVADLLFRTAEVSKLQVVTVLASDGESPAQLEELEHAADALGIHRPVAHASSGDAQAALGGPIDVYVTSRGQARDGQARDGQSGIVALVSAARMHGTDDQDQDRDGSLLARLAPDPLAIRLALMSFPPAEPAELTSSVLAQARETAESWRHRVAEWAEQPSRPVPTQLAAAFQDAFGGLDTGSVLRLLHDLADDDGLPAGSKFESFLAADRVLALDLPRDIGRLGS
jgi:hypothetical protein